MPGIALNTGDTINKNKAPCPQGAYNLKGERIHKKRQQRSGERQDTRGYLVWGLLVPGS